MASGPYIPRADGHFHSWAYAFVSVINANTAVYALSPVDGQTLMQQFERFDAAYRLAKAPATRTRGNILEKDQERNSLQSLCSVYAAIIRANQGISDQDKIAIGVRPRNMSRRRRFAPASSPMVMIIGATQGSHTLRYHDSNTPTSPAKPFGAVCLQLFMDTTDGSREPSIENAKFSGSFTRNLFGVSHKPKDAGKSATYWGRWAGRRGDVGPWSLPVSFTIAWGGAAVRASATTDEQQSLKLAA